MNDRSASPASGSVTAPPDAPAPRVGLIIAALMLALLLAALDQTIVSTALPTIVQDLGGLNHLSWVVTAYLLASTVSSPIYGKLGDLFGRKVILQSAIVLFLIGSALCGLSQSMTQLIIFRAIQGLGAGGLFVITIAVIADVVPARDRGKYQGLFGAVFGGSSIIGPLVGGFFVQSLSWHWIFYINIPIGAVALSVIAVALHTHQKQGHPSIDYLGALTLGGALTATVLFTSLGGNTYAWSSSFILGLIAASVLLLLAFVFAETRAREPIVPLHLFQNSIFSLTSVLGFIVGVAMFGALTFLPLYLQVVKGQSPTASGLQLTPMMAGMLTTSIIAGQLISRFGRYRFFPIMGFAVMTLALFLLSRLDIGTTSLMISLNMVLMGVGLGMLMQVLILVVQNAVDYRHLGVATAAATVFRGIGGSVGLAVFGAIFASRLNAAMVSMLPPGTPIPEGGIDPRAAMASLPPEMQDTFLGAFVTAIHPVFLIAASLAALGFVLAWFLNEIPLRSHAGAPREAQALAE